MKIQIDSEDLINLLKAKQNIYIELLRKLESIGFSDPRDFLNTKSAYEFDNIIVNSMLHLDVNSFIDICSAIDDLEAVGQTEVFADRPKNEVYTFEEFLKDWK